MSFLCSFFASPKCVQYWIIVLSPLFCAAQVIVLLWIGSYSNQGLQATQAQLQFPIAPQLDCHKGSPCHKMFTLPQKMLLWALGKFAQQVYRQTFLCSGAGVKACHFKEKRFAFQILPGLLGWAPMLWSYFLDPKGSPQIDLFIYSRYKIIVGNFFVNKSKGKPFYTAVREGVKAGHFIEMRWGWGAARPYGDLPRLLDWASMLWTKGARACKSICINTQTQCWPLAMFSLP